MVSPNTDCALKALPMCETRWSEGGQARNTRQVQLTKHSKWSLAQAVLNRACSFLRCGPPAPLASFHKQHEELFLQCSRMAVHMRATLR